VSAGATRTRKAALKAAPEPPADQTPQAPEPILALSTLAPVRPIITIDEQPYELAVMNDFGIVDQQQISRDGTEFVNLWERDLDDAGKARLKLVLDRLFAQVARFPQKVKAKLSDGQRGQVVLTFLFGPGGPKRSLLESLVELLGVTPLAPEPETETDNENEIQKPGESSTSAS
jgi:hypothetical protein